MRTCVRAEPFVLNPRSPLAAGLAFAGLGRHWGSDLYHDSTPYGSAGALTGFTGTGNLPRDRWAWDATLNRPALTFNGSTDRVVLPAANTTPTGTAFTYSFWLNRSALYTGTEQHVWSNWYNNGNFFGTLISFSNNDTIRTFTGLGTSAFTAMNTTSSLATATWYNAVWTSDGTTQRLFLNASQQATLARSVVWSPSNQSARLGNVNNSGETFYLPGSLADPMLWFRALSTEEIKALADPGNPDLRVGRVPLVVPARRRVLVGFPTVSIAFTASAGSDSLATAISSTPPPSRTVAFSAIEQSCVVSASATTAAPPSRSVAFSATEQSCVASVSVTTAVPTPRFVTFSVTAAPATLSASLATAAPPSRSFSFNAASAGHTLSASLVYRILVDPSIPTDIFARVEELP